MKKYNNIFKALFFCGVTLLYSCEPIDLDLKDNPNKLTEDQLDASLLLNSIQEDFARNVEGFGRRGAQVVRMDYMNGRNYQNAFSAASMDRRWRISYKGMMFDIAKMNAIAAEKGYIHHIAMGQVMQAYNLMALVDMFGDVPYSEAFLGLDNLNPIADPGAQVYASAITLLDNAIANFKNDSIDSSLEPALDMYYDGDWAKWVKAANTIKMKAYMATRLVDADAITKFNDIAADPDNFISSTADDFQFRWGTNEVQPDTRHPRYLNSYTGTGGARYMSNSFMDYMTGTDPGAYFSPANFDIRVMYYFFRQSRATPGIDGEDPDEEKLECGLIPIPDHYVGFTYCGVSQGWWGRDHGNNNGIPPDGFDRTLEGVYPSGGKLDDISFGSQRNGSGNGGNGITPIMLASWTKFMIAETQMIAGDAAAASVSMFEGINQSIDKVINFAPVTGRFNAIFGAGIPGLVLSQTEYIALFNTDLSADWTAADTDGKWNILAQQYFVACYGNGIDPYNFYRRTGYPTNLQPNIEPSPGAFFRSFYYPANAANNNSSITQKSGVTDQVFWDTNPSSPGFPIAN